MAETIKAILCFFGICILLLSILLMCGIGCLTLLSGIIKLALRPRSKFLRWFLQIIPASLEFMFFAGVFAFVGASIGAVIEAAFPFMPAINNGMAIGCLFGGMWAFPCIREKWGHCYLNEHNYAPVLGHVDGGVYLPDACTRCGKQPAE